MTIWDVLDLAGAVAGIAVLAVMALVPVLLALPQRVASTRVVIPAQRTAAPALRMHSAA